MSDSIKIHRQKTRCSDPKWSVDARVGPYTVLSIDGKYKTHEGARDAVWHYSVQCKCGAPPKIMAQTTLYPLEIRGAKNCIVCKGKSDSSKTRRRLKDRKFVTGFKEPLTSYDEKRFIKWTNDMMGLWPVPGR